MDDFIISFDILFQFQFFKERSVIRMFSMKTNKLPKIQTENIVFITRPGLNQMDKIADKVKSEEISNGTGNRIDFHILFVPSKSLLCEMRLKERGVYGSFTYLDELSLSWLVVISRKNIRTFNFIFT